VARAVHAELGDVESAIRAGCSPQTFSRILAGQSCQASTIVAVSARLGFDLAGTIAEPAADDGGDEDESSDATSVEVAGG
jgi:hypothetical protein